MALCRYVTYVPMAGRQKRWGWVDGDRVFPLDDQAVARAIVLAEGPLAALGEQRGRESLSLADLDVEPGRYGKPSLAAPIIAGQEVWAAGVTYESSKFARMGESAEGADFYARVYVAERPELFFKATPNRVIGPGGAVRIRSDATWSVPEPELAALIAPTGRVLGYLVGNDMSSRDIEGENPLYLPQAKVYSGSCGLGPWIVPAEQVDPSSLDISLTIRRNGEDVFEGFTSTARMRRSVEDLASWLFRENEFPQGVILLTGTGIIPPDEFTLHSGDEVVIQISSVGTLRNTIE